MLRCLPADGMIATCSHRGEFGMSRQGRSHAKIIARSPATKEVCLGQGGHGLPEMAISDIPLKHEHDCRAEIADFLM
jgi:hypothetical protein